MEAQSQCQRSIAVEPYKYMGTYISVFPSSTAAAVDQPACSLMRLPPKLEANRVQVPALHCSFPTLLHPLYDEVKEQCDLWIQDVAQPQSAAARQLLLDCLLPRLACRNLAASPSVTRLVHAVKMVAWLTIADDDDDHPDALGTADHLTTSRSAGEVLAILHCTDVAELMDYCPSTVKRKDLSNTYNTTSDVVGLPSILYPNQRSEKREMALIALAALWAEMLTEMGGRGTLHTRFVSCMEDYLDAVKVQAMYRKTQRLPDIEAYKETRRQASFVLPCLALMEYALVIELDDATYAHEQLQELRHAVTDYIWLCNDLVSCKVEMGVGDYFNMPSVVYNAARTPHDKGWTLQGALNAVADMAHDLDAQCVTMSQSIHQLEGSVSPEVLNTYVGGLLTTMSGSLAWYYESARYDFTNN